MYGEGVRENAIIYCILVKFEDLLRWRLVLPHAADSRSYNVTLFVSCNRTLTPTDWQTNCGVGLSFFLKTQGAASNPPTTELANWWPKIASEGPNENRSQKCETGCNNQRRSTCRWAATVPCPGLAGPRDLGRLAPGCGRSLQLLPRATVILVGCVSWPGHICL